jgi:hypothetical protein
MRPLSAAGLLRVWERGQAQRPFDRAMTLLAAGLPDQSPETVAGLSIGQRDGALIALREQSMGGQLRAYAECPACKAELTFTLRTEDLRNSASADAQAGTGEVSRDGISVSYRLPSSRDFEDLPAKSDAQAIRDRLARRCMIDAQRDGRQIDAGELPPALIDEISEAMARQDPQAEILINLSCPECDHRWSDFFDISSFFWMEITVMAKRLLADVDALARRYGWREADILAMTPMRRHTYLQLGER